MLSLFRDGLGHNPEASEVVCLSINHFLKQALPISREHAAHLQSC